MAFFTGTLAFAACWVLFAAFLPPLEEPELSAKLRHIASAETPYDAFFVGSSRIRRQISPVLFDREFARHGQAIRSYNLGLDALTFPELSFVYRRLLDTVKEAPRLVVVDLNGLRRKIDRSQDAQSVRAIQWHDLRHTAVLFRAILRDPQGNERSFQETVNLLATHLGIMLRHYSRAGQGAEWTRSHLTPTSRDHRPPGVDGRGFFPVTSALAGTALSTYREKLAEMPPGATQPVRRDPVLEEEFALLARDVRQRGGEIVFFYGPTVTTTRPAAAPEQGARGASLVLAYDDPAQFPALYQPEHRYDVQHLNLAGAQIFSTQLAADISAGLKGQGRWKP